MNNMALLNGTKILDNIIWYSPQIFIAMIGLLVIVVTAYCLIKNEF